MGPQSLAATVELIHLATLLGALWTVMDSFEVLQLLVHRKPLIRYDAGCTERDQTASYQ